MRFRLPHILLLLAGIAGATAYSQEPSASLRQADADYRAGVEALNHNDLKAAQSKFESVVRLAPAAEQGHSALGAVLVREGQWAAGTRELEKALALKPNDSAAQLNLAMVYAQSGAASEAIPLFQKLDAEAHKTQHPLDPAVQAAYARSLARSGETRRAVSEMKEALAQDSRNAELHDELGSLYAMQKDWAPAEQEFSEAVRLKDDLASAHLHLGLVLQAEQKPGAIEECAKAYALAPGDPAVALTAGKALADAGRDSEAVPILEHAVELQPKSADAAYQLAIVLQRVDRVPEAIDLLKRVVHSEPANAAALTNLGMALAQMHKATEGIPFLKKAVTIDPSDPTAHQDLAAAYIQINQIEDAVAELKVAIRLSPDSPQLHYDLGTAYKLQDDATDAIPELETAAKLNPAGYEPPYVLGLLYLQVGRYQEAAQQLEVSLKLHPQNGEAWATLGSVYSKLDRLPEAASALRKAIEQMPDQSDSHLLLASVLVKQNDTAGAAAERKVAADLMRKHMNLQRAEVATNSGKSLLASGKIDDAIVQFRDALSFDPSYTEAHLKLAEALDKQGKTAEAAAERAQAEKLNQASQ
jgi:tetratricopeptide (TPR) repeat protein